MVRYHLGRKDPYRLHRTSLAYFSALVLSPTAAAAVRIDVAIPGSVLNGTMGTEHVNINMDTKKSLDFRSEWFVQPCNITGEHSKYDQRFTQQPFYFLTLLWSPVIAVRRTAYDAPLGLIASRTRLCTGIDLRSSPPNTYPSYWAPHWLCIYLKQQHCDRSSDRYHFRAVCFD